MSRLQPLLAVFLCLTLTVAAPAQNANPTTVNVKRGQTLSLSLVTPLDSSRAKVGDDVQLKLVRPLMADGAVVLPAEWIVHGTVTKVEHAGPKCKYGFVVWKISVVSTPQGDQLKVQQVVSYPYDPNRTGDPESVPMNTPAKAIGHGASLVGEAVVFVALSPFLVPLAIAMSGGECAGEPGRETTLSPGIHALYAVSRNTRVRPLP